MWQGALSMPEIRLDNVSKLYKVDKKLKQYAVRELSATISQGEFVFLVGSSGAGKSTMLKLIGGEIAPDKGSVLVDDVSISRFFGPWKVRLARTFGIVSQQPVLVRKRTIEENLMMAARAGGMQRKSQAASEKALGLVGLSGVEKCYPAELSIGEVRRVELARALVNSPPVLLLDELTANLDDDNIWDIMHLLNELNTRGTTIIMATHASQFVNIMRRRVVTLVDGRIFGDVKNGKYGDIV
jgi:cell division transport system ATP-binding protein